MKLLGKLNCFVVRMFRNAMLSFNFEVAVNDFHFYETIIIFSPNNTFDYKDTTCRRECKGQMCGPAPPGPRHPVSECRLLSMLATAGLYTRNSAEIFCCAHKNEVNDAISSQFKV